MSLFFRFGRLPVVFLRKWHGVFPVKNDGVNIFFIPLYVYFHYFLRPFLPYCFPVSFICASHLHSSPHSEHSARDVKTVPWILSSVRCRFPLSILPYVSHIPFPTLYVPMLPLSRTPYPNNSRCCRLLLVPATALQYSDGNWILFVCRLFIDIWSAVETA